MPLLVRLIGDALDRATTLPAPAEPPSRDALVFYGCLAISALSGIALLQLRNPRSFLSRLVDRPADENTTREVQS